MISGVGIFDENMSRTNRPGITNPGISISNLLELLALNSSLFVSMYGPASITPTMIFGFSVNLYQI